MLKTLNEVPGDQEGASLPLHPLYILEASFKLPRVLSSVTFGQEGHLSLAVRNLAQDFLSRAPAIPASQPLCCQEHRAGGKVGSGSAACLPPQLRPSHSTTHVTLDAWVPDVAPGHIFFGSHRTLKMFESFIYT